MLKFDIRRIITQRNQGIQCIRECYLNIHRIYPLHLRRIMNLCLLIIALFTFSPVNCQGNYCSSKFRFFFFFALICFKFIEFKMNLTFTFEILKNFIVH